MPARCTAAGPASSLSTSRVPTVSPMYLSSYLSLSDVFIPSRLFALSCLCARTFLVYASIWGYIRNWTAAGSTRQGVRSDICPGSQTRGLNWNDLAQGEKEEQRMDYGTVEQSADQWEWRIRTYWTSYWTPRDSCGSRRKTGWHRRCRLTATKIPFVFGNRC
ncbi:uncharacterized protein LOC107264654 [Cephus cinctus]|uniref:Uncharacterized protein LOC107264654 n=1 Tax=Cephus cinctus TaxID=211228 RepID=A0AAJ7FF24_CEPCN|nr:uncharacterized protein LOC107264654 [Cephus cinctus]